MDAQLGSLQLIAAALRFETKAAKRSTDGRNPLDLTLSNIDFAYSAAELDEGEVNKTGASDKWIPGMGAVDG